MHQRTHSEDSRSGGMNPPGATRTPEPTTYLSNTRAPVSSSHRRQRSFSKAWDPEPPVPLRACSAGDKGPAVAPEAGLAVGALPRRSKCHGNRHYRLPLNKKNLRTRQAAFRRPQLTRSVTLTTAPPPVPGRPILQGRCSGLFVRTSVQVACSPRAITTLPVRTVSMISNLPNMRTAASTLSEAPWIMAISEVSVRSTVLPPK